MILFYLNNQNQNHARIIRNLFRSYQGTKQIQTTLKFAQSTALNQKAKMIVFAGILRGEGLIYKYCVENKKNFLYIDHSYLDRGYNKTNEENEWMRATYNAFTWSLNQKESNERWNQYFQKKYTLSPWNTKGGKNILVLPPSEATKAIFPHSVEWMENALTEIKKITVDPIVIRNKPKQPVVDINTNKVTSRLNFNYEKTIEAEMLDAKLIVTFNSAVPVLGTILGIPCYCSQYAAAYPMNINLDNIENPPEPSRQEWLNQLVYHQYTTTEIKNGNVWNLLEKYIR